MAGPSPSPPIDIKRSSASPQSSNLTTALDSANNKLSPNKAMDIPRRGREPGRPTTGRQDSLGLPLSSSNTGTRPISVGANPWRDSATTGSYMNGMSWGGKSVSSLFQDDILMGGTSPAIGQSPSFHSSSYLPKMEANFWHGLRCCEIGFSDLHELMAHYDQVHASNPSTFPHRASLPGGGRFARRKSSTPGVNNPESMRYISQLRGSQSSGTNGAQALRPQPSQDGANSRSNLSTVQDMDTIGDMEMDYEQYQGPDQPTNDHNVASTQAPTPQSMNPTTTARPPPINASLANMTRGNANDPSPESVTPTTADHRFSGQKNPIAPSADAPTLSPKAVQNQQAQTSPRYPKHAAAQIKNLSNEFSNLDFRHGNEMLDLCINEPAKALYTDQGGFNAQQFPHFGFANGAATYMEDPAAASAQAAELGGQTAFFGGEEDRPFRCPVIGCEKAYKNANGLRYHEKHGHASQKLQENGDGTYSIVDPVTSIPYPGTVGMEKEKPYRCETCGKRYKNLNGLKYHRNHSPACNPDYNFAATALPNMDQVALNGDAVF